MRSIDDLKACYTIQDAWNDEAFPGIPSKSGHSPFREDRKPSFSVFEDGRKWKDHATGESGDVFGFLQLARNCSFSEALRIVRERTNSSVARIPCLNKSIRRKKRISSKSPKRRKAEFAELPQELANCWNEGVQYLENSLGKCTEIDNLRNWPSGITETLCGEGLISFPEIYGKRGIAFPVIAKMASGGFSTGFHYRCEISGKWFFFPNLRKHGKSTVPLPYILGSGFLDTANLLIITEGQWDCISFAAWSGWMESDASWPENVVCIGIRGAHNWRKLTEFHSWPSDVSVILIPDNDPAGMTWKTEFLNVLKKRSAKVSVFVPSKGDLGDQLNLTENKVELLSELVRRSA